MPTFTLSDHIRTNLGEPVGGIRVRAYAINVDETLGSSHIAETYTSSSTGEWELTNLNPASSPTGTFAIETYNPSTQESRIRMGNIRLQVGFLTGPYGEAPINDGAITTAKLADAGVTDTKIGQRTADPNLSSPANSGTLTQFVSWIAGALRSIKGTTNWYDPAPTTLQAAATHINTVGNAHGLTPAQLGAVQNLGTIGRMRSGNDSAKSTGVAGDVYFATDTQIIYRHNGSTWQKMAVGSYDVLDDKPGSSAQSMDFGRVSAGGSTLIADQVGDTLNIVAGSGITITSAPTTDTLTISATAGAGGSVGAHTHPGSDITGTVSDSTSLRGWNGGNYPRVMTTQGFANSGANPSTNGLIIQPGSVNVSVSGGSGRVNFPFDVQGYASIMLMNGDYGAYTGHFILDNSNAGTDAWVSFRTSPTNHTGPVRVNYIVIYW